MSKDEEFIQWFQKGIDECRDEKVDDSIESFKKAIDIYPEEGTARVYLAKSYMKKIKIYSSEDENYMAALKELTTAVKYLPKGDADAKQTYKDLMRLNDSLNYEEFDKRMNYWMEHNPEDCEMAFWGSLHMYKMYQKYEEVERNLFTVIDAIECKYDLTPEDMILNIKHSLTDTKPLYAINKITNETIDDIPPFSIMKIKKPELDIPIEIDLDDTLMYQSSQLLLFMLYVNHLKDKIKAGLMFICIWQTNFPLARDMLLPMLIETQIDHGHRYHEAPPAILEIEQSSKKISEQWATFSHFETKLKLFIVSCLQKKYKEDWWKRGISRKNRQEAEWRQRADTTEHSRNVSLAFYFDLFQCKYIIDERWESVFIKYLENAEDNLSQWFETLNNYRKLLAHNTRALDESEYKDLCDIVNKFLSYLD